MLDLDSPRDNHLLAALPADEWERLLPEMELWPLPLGHVLYESGDEMRHVYFPTTSIVSLLYVMENGSSAEIAIVGNEGIVGISLFMGGESTPESRHRAERGPRLSRGRQAPQRGIRSCGASAAPPVAV